jgi:hypothetical protein
MAISLGNAGAGQAATAEDSLRKRSLTADSTSIIASVAGER